MNQTLGTKWYVRHCAVAAGVCLCVYVLLLSLFALLTVRGVIGESQMERCVWVSAAFASAAGAVLSGNKTAKRGIMILCCAGSFFAAVLLLGFLIGGTLLPRRVLWLMLPILIGAAATFLLTGRKNTKRKKAKHRGKVRR